MIKSLLLFFLRVYKLTLSPLLVSIFGNACIYKVTCSEYARIMIQKHGPVKGIELSFKRFMSCNLVHVKTI